GEWPQPPGATTVPVPCSPRRCWRRAAGCGLERKTLAARRTGNGQLLPGATPRSGESPDSGVAHVLQNPLAMKREPPTMRRELKGLRAIRRTALVGILAVAAGALTLRAHAEDAGAAWQSPESIAAAARGAISGAGRIEAVAVDE